MLQCGICGYKTDRKSNYTRHVNNKCSNKRFSCNYCPKSYKYKSGLSRHLKKCENYNKALEEQNNIVLFKKIMKKKKIRKIINKLISY